MAKYSARPETQRAQRAWDVLAARYPKMKPIQLVSEVKGSLGWQWSMEFKSSNGSADFWDSISVAEIRKLVDDASKDKKSSAARKVKVMPKKR